MTVNEDGLLLREVQELVAEYSDRLPAGRVIECVAGCHEELVSMGVTAGIAPAVQTMARLRLSRQ